ncbi:unnamed protein product [Mytilus coruscus]|uniref:Uncharacterized protein n=1 Tax=Mytilus coruscus TaxID=42192 RepID=A0A6J8ARL6_MYTCO|nr:unnamed protein product [Mytilus coruscus]
MHAWNRIISTFKCIGLYLRDLGANPLNCFNCELLQLKQFLQNQTFGDADAKCDGTNHMVVDFNFTDCTDMTTGVAQTTTQHLTSTIRNSQSIPRSSVVTTEPISDAVTTVKTTVTNTPVAPIIQTTIDAITTKEPTTDAIASTPYIVETTISTTEDTQLTSTITPVAPKADNSAVMAGTVTGASVVVSVIASFVILKMQPATVLKRRHDLKSVNNMGLKLLKKFKDIRVPPRTELGRVKSLVRTEDLSDDDCKRHF